MADTDAFTDLVERLEGDERLDAFHDTVGPLGHGLAEGPAGSFLRGDWLGHALHPLLTDLPIGFWTSATVLDLVGGRAARPAARRLVGLGVALVPLTAAAGAVDLAADHRPAVRRVGGVHAVGNAAAALLYLGSWQARRRNQHLRGAALALVGASLASVTGYLGGHLAYGRGVSVGPRGAVAGGETSETPARDSGTGAERAIADEGAFDPGAEVGVEEAAGMLSVPREQVETMVTEGILTPVGDGSPHRFTRAEVLAVRHMGG